MKRRDPANKRTLKSEASSKKGDMEKPFKLDILGWEWEVRLLPLEALHKDMDGDTDGLCIYAENLILIRQLDNPDYNFDTLVHELTHATLHIFRNHSSASILEEDVCVATPHIVKSIMEQWDKIPDCCKFKQKEEK